MPAPFRPLSIRIALFCIVISFTSVFAVRAVTLIWIYFYQRNAERIKNLSESPPTFTVGKYLFEVWQVLVPAAVNDNPTHSTLVESAIFPLPTFTDISLPDGFSFRFDTPKGEMAARHFVLFLRPSFYSGGCGSPLLTLLCVAVLLLFIPHYSVFVLMISRDSFIILDKIGEF